MIEPLHRQTTKEDCQCNLIVDKGPFDADIADIKMIKAKRQKTVVEVMYTLHEWERALGKGR